MQLILAAALCSVIVSIFLMLCKKRGIDTLQMIAWNYAIAIILCFFWFEPDFSHFSVSTTPWWIIVILSILLPSIFLSLGRALQSAGIVKTEIAQRLSVVLSVIAAYALFQEQFNHLKIVGLVFGLVAVSCLLFSRSATAVSGQSLKYGNIYLLVVWVGYALVDILLKYTSSLGLKFALTLNLTFVGAFILSVIILMIRKTDWTLKALGAGLALGLINFANIAFYVKAHQLLKDAPAVVFAGMNILVVVLGGLAGLILFKEKLNKSLFMALLFGIAGVICLALGLY